MRSPGPSSRRTQKRLHRNPGHSRGITANMATRGAGQIGGRQPGHQSRQRSREGEIPGVSLAFFDQKNALVMSFGRDVAGHNIRARWKGMRAAS